MGGNESGIGIIRIDNETQLVLYSLKVGALIGLRHRQGLFIDKIPRHKYRFPFSHS